MRRFLAFVGLYLLCAQVFANQEVSLGFNSDGLRASYFNELSSNNLVVDAGWLHHKDKGDVVHAGIHLVDQASSGRNRLVGGLGGRVLYSDGDNSNQSGFAFPVGGFLTFIPSQFDRVSLTGSAYYAPDILTIGDMEKYQEYGLRLSYNLLREATVYVGARYVKGGYDDAPSVRYDTGMHVGLSIRF